MSSEPSNSAKPGGLRVAEYCRRIVASKFFTRFIIGFILAAGILVGVETFPSMWERYKSLFYFLDALILWVFAIEILLKIGAQGKYPWRYFKDGWNVFDFTIVTICFLPIGGSYITVLRLFRLLRVIRLISVVPKLQMLVTALLRSLPSMFYVCLLLTLLFYIYAVLGVMLFAGNDPVHFGNLWSSLLSLFRIVTLEDWTDIMYLQMFGSDVYQGYNQSVQGLEFTPKAMPVIGAVYFVSFVLAGTMIMLNLVIGVIINGMDEAQKEVADRNLHAMLTEKDNQPPSREAQVAKLQKKLEDISKEISELV